jgi:hypothetical protein
VDEIWTFVEKKQGRLSPEEKSTRYDIGDVYLWTAIDQDTKLLACYALYQGNAMRLWQQLFVYSATLWVCCMVCHGELAHSKPAPRYATLFYLMVAAGGAVGGILVAAEADTGQSPPQADP